jgi:hypothetical protein
MTAAGNPYSLPAALHQKYHLPPMREVPIGEWASTRLPDSDHPLDSIFSYST